MNFSMVALDSAVRAPSHIRFNLSAVLIVGGLLGGACAVAVPLSLLGTTYEGWALAARTTDEFAGLLFLIAFLAEPLAHLFPKSLAPELQPGRRRLSLGFVAAYGVCLLVAVFAAAADGQKLGVPQVFSIVFQFCVLAVMVVTSGIWSAEAAGKAVWRRVHTSTLWFFWLVYTFAYVGHFSGPHIPDASFGVGLLLLVQALFIRHVVALKEIWVSPLAEKVG
jgi:hypothetical protein